MTEAYKQIANLQEEIKNQITGGNSIPYLKLLTTKIISSNSGEKYFIVFFSLELKGKFPLQNVKCTIYDNESLRMLTYGVSHIRDGLSYTSENPSAKDISNYNAVKKFDVGTLTNKAPNTLYMASCHYDANLKAKPHFNVEINWNNGSLTHFISLSAENNLVKFKSVESIFNGEKIETYGKYMVIENAK